MYFDCSWFDRVIKDTWLHFKASNGYTTAFHYTLKNLEVLYDPCSYISGLKEVLHTPYPEQLRQNIIDRNLALMTDKPFSSYLEQMKKAVARNDLNSVNHRLAGFLASYFDVLFAANRLLHPGEKRLASFAVQNCRILPGDFESDMNSILTATPSDIPVSAKKLSDNLKAIL